MNHLTLNSQVSFLRAEARSLQEPELLDCDVCQEEGYANRDECGLDCKHYDEWEVDE